MPGWGQTKANGDSSNVLKQLQVPVITNSECKRKYKKIDAFYADNQFSEHVLCAGGTGGIGVWKGDSGGPLMIPILTGRSFPFYQIGVVSYTKGFVQEDVPAVYASVQDHADWITEKLDGNRKFTDFLTFVN